MAGNSGRYPLTQPQKGIWYLEKLYSGTSIGNIAAIIKIKNDCDCELLMEAIAVILRRDRSLSIRISDPDTEPHQYFYNGLPAKTEYFDFSRNDGEELERWQGQMTATPFVLADSCLHYFAVFRTAGSGGGFYIKLHHFICDAWTMVSLTNRVVRYYTCLKTGEEIPEEEFPGYDVFIKRENDYLSSERPVADRDFWIKSFEKIPEPVLKENRHSHLTGTESTRRTYRLDPVLAGSLGEYCSSNGISPFILFLAAVSVYISRIHGSRDFVIGTPVLNRINRKEKNVSGMFVSTIPFRINFDGEKDFTSLARGFAADWMRILRHHQYPYEKLLRELREKQRFSHNLYEIVLSYQNARLNLFERIGEYEAEWLFNGNQTDPLCIHVNERDNDGSIEIDYDCMKGLFTEDDINGIHRRLVFILEDIVADPGKKASELRVMSDEEINAVLIDFNNTVKKYRLDKTVDCLFEEQAARTPDAIAVISEDAALTYGELDIKASLFAERLLENGLRKGETAGIIAGRSVDLAVIILGVLKAGCSFLPVDPGYPDARAGLMVRESGTRIIAAQAGLGNSIKNSGYYDPGIHKIVETEGLEKTGLIPLHLLEKKHKAEDPAYVLFTSGSTGTPKGVVVSHRSLVNFSHGIAERLLFKKGAKILSITSISFDVFIFELIPSLLKGLTVIIADDEAQKVPWKLSELILRYGVDKLYITPSRLGMFISDKKSSECLGILKEIVIGGEDFGPGFLDKVRRMTRAKIYNAYGPTEATIGATLKEIVNAWDISLGKPSANIFIYILDNNMKPVPPGVEGEIYIGGEAPAIGYINSGIHPGNNFLKDPFRSKGRIYRTGDLGKWTSNGEIRFSGRADRQIKIRGYRIETGEVESRLMQLEHMQSVFVTDMEDSEGKKTLCAYYTAERQLDNAYLRSFLSRFLPDYMIPSYFTQISSMPVNASGKTDKTMLPKPVYIRTDTKPYRPPSTNTEILLSDIWKSMLRISEAGIDDDLFESGGDSLSVVYLVSMVHKVFNVEISTTDVYNNPTVEKLALMIEKTARNIFEPITPVPVKESYKLSAAQRRLYLLTEQQDTGTAYNTSGILQIEGNLDKQRLRKSIEKLIKRHEALRTCFRNTDSGPVQIITDKVDADYEEVLWESLPTGVLKHADEPKLFARIAAASFSKPFRLDKAPLFRAVLITLPLDKHYLFIDMHHIISDGVSAGIIMSELVQTYEGADLSRVKAQYKDFAEWQNRLFESGYLKKQEEYWLELLSDEIPVLMIPADRPRPSIKTYRGSTYSFYADESLTACMKKIASEHSATLYMFLLAAYNVLLAFYSGQEDILVGTPVTGRRHADTNGIIGMFANTLVMRNFPAGGMSFSDFLHSVRDNSLKAFENQDCQFDELVVKLKVRRDPSRNPIFDVMFVLQKNENASYVVREPAGSGKLRLTPYKAFNETSKFDMLLEATEKEEGIIFNLEYSSDLFDKETIERMASHYINIIKEVLKKPETHISDIDILSGKEKKNLTNELNNLGLCNDNGLKMLNTIHSAFSECAARYPDAAAVTCEGESISYSDLDRLSERLGRTFASEGAASGTVAGIMMKRSPTFVACLIAIIKTGAAFLPLDPDYPEERIAYMLHDSGASLLICRDGEGEVPPGYNGRIIRIRRASGDCNVIDDLDFVRETGDRSMPGNALYNANAGQAFHDADPESTLYIIYTSGSTGRPKGVIIPHRCIINLIRTEYGSSNIDFRANVLQFTTISFDVCYQEIFSTLLAGGRLVIADEEIKRNPVRLTDLAGKEQVSVLFIPPSYLKLMASDRSVIERLPLSLKHIIVAGEQLIINNTLKKFLKERRIFLHNHYGPSETHVATMYTVDPGKDIPSVPPIGKPVCNSGVYVLNKNGSLSPIGVWGEIYITGECVGKGYLGKPQLTAEKFLPDRFSPGMIMYRTGDIARWGADGNLEFMGRIDHQVKIRGYRIEPGEIESRLSEHERIKEVAVVLKEDEQGRKSLCAFYISTEEISIAELREFLSDRLPEYMIPGYFGKIDSMPLTPSGKIDRTALSTVPVQSQSEAVYSAPENKVHEQLASIWKEVLDMKENIGIDDNFFDRGGDSLAILQVQIKAFPYNWGLHTQDFYRYQTIRRLAEKIIAGKRNTAVDSSVNENPEIVYNGKHYLAFDNKKDYRGGTENGGMHEDNDKMKKIILTGATGFLGAHILAVIAEESGADVYCIIRHHSDMSPDKRLAGIIRFYFGNKYDQLFGKRIFAVEGDISLEKFGLPENDYLGLVEGTDAVINSAALVSHYGRKEAFTKTNIEGAVTAAAAAQSSGACLYHISTTGIAGVYDPVKLAGMAPVFSENSLDIGQEISNPYIRSKYEAEKILNKMAEDGLKAAVLRVGNITPRYEDGRFQINTGQNAFRNMIYAMYRLGAYCPGTTGSGTESKIDLTPVDLCARAVWLIACRKCNCGRTYHIAGDTLGLEDIAAAMRKMGAGIKKMNAGEYDALIRKLSEDGSYADILKGVIQRMDYIKEKGDRLPVRVQRLKTVRYLKKLGFEWNKPEARYLSAMITSYINGEEGESND
ncbi:MAG: amino acid adenylation domain-containing protein [Eubacteriales bacterium]|nr:amino acid adenylation domain-containing protein [Eubacteriales bacterium]